MKREDIVFAFEFCIYIVALIGAILLAGVLVVTLINGGVCIG